MPELPEVETIRRQLAPLVRGRTIETFEVLDKRLTAPLAAAGIRRQVEGRVINELSRRGKYLRFELEGGGTLVLHLRMTGRLAWVDGSTHQREREPEPDETQSTDVRHLRLVIRLDNAGRLYFHDTRRFGTAEYIGPGEEQAYWSRLGPEPLERTFNRSTLAGICRGRSKAVKSTIMDQRLIAGIGNIYADESLFRAGINPAREAGDLDEAEVAALCHQIKTTLRDAIRLQGSSIDTYADTTGRRGGFQETFRVHRREGEPCPLCGSTVMKTKVGGRGTYYCPDCQS